MGHSKIIPLIIRKVRTKEYVAPWHTKSGTNVVGCGKPTSENLSKWRDKYNQSLGKGYHSHLDPSKHWLQCDLEIYSQITGEILATFRAPMFEVIN